MTNNIEKIQDIENLSFLAEHYLEKSKLKIITAESDNKYSKQVIDNMKRTHNLIHDLHSNLILPYNYLNLDVKIRELLNRDPKINQLQLQIKLKNAPIVNLGYISENWEGAYGE